MSRPHDPIFLLAKYPPYAVEATALYTGEERLWWATLRQAAHDLRYEHESEALDALEFLRSTGQWVAEALFAIDPIDYQRQVAGLVSARNRARGGRLPLEKLDKERSLGTASRHA